MSRTVPFDAWRQMREVLAYAEGRLRAPSSPRLEASRILSIDRVPQTFNVQTLQQLPPNGIKSFHYDESLARLRIRFLDTYTVFNVRGDIHDDWIFKKLLFDCIQEDENSFFLESHPK
ncbi:uncharacterized protein ARMOST_06119 [Armillaria ostoyae]|uniref:Uncharacterized protein n=1 Tax=Armillaria ostoyae TaxID=47428 RepID=A0A284R246_ARMOS|nr:uncharacterized protein ARMOST_06119 [Armillaria ostoyae]